MLYHQIHLTLGYLIIRRSPFPIGSDLALTNFDPLEAHEIRLIRECRLDSLRIDHYLLLVLPYLSFRYLAEVKGDSDFHAVLRDLLLIEHLHFKFFRGSGEGTRSDQVLETLVLKETQEVTLLTLEDQKEGAG
jgi:alpha-amylase/alpha-mannosidase (GH57 family)